MQDLSVTLIQCELAWEQPEDNRRQIGEIIAGLEATDIIVLPEMFTTGFSMNALANAEAPGGATEQWLQALAQHHDCALTGSIAVQADGGVYNRMLFATPDGVAHYDKRHLFRMAGEHNRYLSGARRVISGAAGVFCCKFATTCVFRSLVATGRITTSHCMWRTGQQCGASTGANYSSPGLSKTCPVWSA